MHKTFSLENMETYFANYISCNEHKHQPITNFCTQGPCLKFMCPECIEHHSEVHSNHVIDSIKTCIKKTSERLRETAFALENQTGRNSFLQGSAPQQYTKQLIRELEEVKEGLIQEIKTYFKEKEQHIRKQTSKYAQIQRKIETLKKDLMQATNQLKMLDRHLFVPEQTVKAVTKANKINFRGMLRHFHTRIEQVERQMVFNIRLEMNPEKRDILRRSLNELIGVRNKNDNNKSMAYSYNNPSRAINYPKEQRNRQKPIKASKNMQASKAIGSPYQLNPQLLSADRLLHQNSFRIQTQNYFKAEPFLHFFEVTNSALHMININQIRQGQAIKWNVIPLDIKFQIPSFHRTVATQNGAIYVIGGTAPNKVKKSKIIYRFDPEKRTLVDVSELIVPRSSHSILCHKQMIYISGGMTDNQQVLKKCEMFNPKTKEVSLMPSCKYPTTNSCLSAIGEDLLVKLGGVFPNGENNDTIQIWNVNSSMWTEIDPTIQNMNGQFGLLSCSGWAPLNKNQIFIFGGYNQEAGSQNSRMSFVLQYNNEDNQFYIKYVNHKNPPIAQGFWSQQGMVHNSMIYCLQNVDGEEENDCLEDKKNILMFNGKTWSTCMEGE